MYIITTISVSSTEAVIRIYLMIGSAFDCYINPRHVLIYHALLLEWLGVGEFSADMEVAEGCFRHIMKIFEELEDYRSVL